mmetsp:Transcript_36982/g.104389  ORF Transcript_36982/g.104389 Transcript_36982/m.104389 type:complete len:260 (+) Transcript_36982:424-1203(+)
MLPDENSRWILSSLHSSLMISMHGLLPSLLDTISTRWYACFRMMKGYQLHGGCTNHGCCLVRVGSKMSSPRMWTTNVVLGTAGKSFRSMYWRAFRPASQPAPGLGMMQFWHRILLADRCQGQKSSLISFWGSVFSGQVLSIGPTLSGSLMIPCLFNLLTFTDTLYLSASQMELMTAIMEFPRRLLVTSSRQNTRLGLHPCFTHPTANIVGSLWSLMAPLGHLVSLRGNGSRWDATRCAAGTAPAGNCPPAFGAGSPNIC